MIVIDRNRDLGWAKLYFDSLEEYDAFMLLNKDKVANIK